MSQMMECGCVATAKVNGEWVCSVHYFTAKELGSTPMKILPELVGRQAKCAYCGEVADSINWERLPFFQYQPDMEMDSFYSGCRGWE